jgi:Fe-S cluster biogenesis protein NfuA
VLIVSERTPNPDAMRFSPGRRLVEGPAQTFGRADFRDVDSPLAARLFAMDGVRQVYVAADFVTVTREPRGVDWEDLRGPVIMAIADHLASGDPAIDPLATRAEAPVDCDQIEAEIRDVLARHVRPAVARDGGDILFARFDGENGVLHIRMEGACGGCPSSRLTLKAGVENIMRHYIPEVLRVESAEDEDAASGPMPAGRPKWMARLGGLGRAGGRHAVTFTHERQAWTRTAGPP